MEEIIPKNSYSDFKKYPKSLPWLNFSSRITKNPFVKEYLLKRDGRYCKWCKKAFIKEPVIHHLDYNHECSFNQNITVSCLKKTGKKGTRNTPNCELCMLENINAFKSCMSRLVLVHDYCNYSISTIVKTNTR